jgi:hypothetical protein
MVPPAPSKSQRNREWERAQRSGDLVQVSYRRIPKELRNKVTQIAVRLIVPTDEVARALLEYAVEAYEDGHLRLDAKPAVGRNTLFTEK